MVATRWKEWNFRCKKLTPFASSLSYNFADKSKNQEERGSGPIRTMKKHTSPYALMDM